MERLLPMSGIVDKVRAALERRSLTGKSACILVAVSGGADSMALLNALNMLAPECGFTLAAAHFDHMIRPRSGEDAAFVESECDRLGVRVVSGRQDVPKYAKEKKMSIETAAREKRYAFLKEQAARLGAECIALAHHMNDQVETLILNILRGSGAAGLSAMSEYSDGLFRPMLAVARAEVEEWCDESGIAYITDETNTQTQYARNRVRHELLPRLREFNPSFDLAALRLIENARVDSEALGMYAKAAYDAASRITCGGVALECAKLVALPEAVSSRVVMRAIEEVNGSRVDIERKHIQGVLSLLQKRSGARIDLPHMLKAANAYSELLIIRQESYIFYLPLQNTTVTPFGTFTLRAEAHCTAMISSEKHQSALVRTRRPGDWMRPKGLGGRKKVQDILVDCKIPGVYRDSLPLIACDDEVLWIPGVRSGEIEDGVLVGFEPTSVWPLAQRV